MDIDLTQLNEHSESETLEFKESFDKQTLETIGAFANTAGGVILVGVRDDGHVTGVNMGDTTLEDWAQRMQLKLQSRFLPSLTTRRCNNRTVAVIRVERSLSLIAVEGRYYKRVGRTNQIMGPEEHTQRLLAAANRSWDNEIEQTATLADLDEKAINTILVRLNSVGRRNIPAEEKPESSLEKLGLSREGKPTRAAILLLGKDPKRFYPSAFIKAGRFKSATTIVDDKEFGGTILDQIDMAMNWFQDRLSKALVIGKSKLSGSQKISRRSLAEREEVWELPLAALREGVANAVCHRNYVSVVATTLRLYDDRLEIWNAGNLPVQLRIGDLLQEHNSYPFNKLIAEIFYNLGIIERWGSGTVRMAEALTEQGLAPPTFDVSTADTFKLIMHSQKSILSQLSKRQWKALQHLETVDSLTVAEYQELIGVSKATATRDLSDMTSKGVLVSEGRGKGSKYRLASK